MRDRIVIKKNIISFDKDVNEIDIYLESILKKILNTEKDIRILKEKNKSYKLYIDGDYECNFMVEDNVVLYDYMIKIIYKDKTYTYYIDTNKDNLIINMNEYTYKKDNKDYSITNYCNIYEGIVIDRCNKVKVIIEDSSMYRDKFNNILENIDVNYTLEELYNSINNNYFKLKITKSRLIDNKTNELVTDTIYVFNNYLEEFKTTIKKDDRKYIVEKTGDNYTVTYINSSINDIEESYYTINDKIDYVKKLERKKTF